MKKVKKIVNDELFEWIRDIRRTIHQWPELAFKEEKTAEYISRVLKKLGIKYQTGIAQTGIAGKLITNENAPTIALRADMDALPITENTGLPFSSQNPGIMHACGHDGHVAILLGAAAILKKTPPEGNVVFIFQPAEEGDGGAKPMIEEGVLENVDMIFGGHIERHHQVGEICIKTGIHTAYTDAFDIRITGKGGHAARPHETIDAVLIASQFVINLQTIISREIDPLGRERQRNDRRVQFGIDGVRDGDSAADSRRLGRLPLQQGVENRRLVPDQTALRQEMHQVAQRILYAFRIEGQRD